MKSVLYTTIAFSFALMVFASSNLTLVVDDNGITIAPTQAVAFGGGGGDDCNCDDDDDPTPTPTPNPTPKPLPVCKSFSAAPTSLPAGGGDTFLTWQTANATKVTISSIGEVNLNNQNGRKAVVTQTQTFTLTATNSEGSDTCTAKVTVAAPKPAPVCNTFNASATTIVKGASTQLSWTTTNANSASINNGVGSVAVDGSKSVTPAQTTTYTLTAKNADGDAVSCNRTITVTPAPTPAPVCNTFNASATTIVKGASTQLSWTTTNANSASINNGVGSVPVDGSKSVTPAQTTTYTLTAKNSAGTQVTCNRTITVTTPTPVAPSCVLNAAPTSITRGQSSELSYTSQNAVSASINQNIGGVSLSGSRGVTPTVTTTYTMTVTNAAGVTATCARTITVTDAPTPTAPSCVLNAAPTSITRGQSSELSYTSQNATNATIDQNIGGVSLNGSRGVTPTVTTTYTMTVTNAAGATATCARTITVTDVPTPVVPVCNSFTASPSTINRGSSATLEWETTNATTVTINNDIGSVSPDSSRSVTPTVTTTYILTAQNASGTPVTCSRTITVNTPPSDAPVCTLSANPSRIDEGDSTRLTWTSSNTSGDATINQGVGTVNPRDTNDDRNVSPRDTTTYTMTVTNAAGTNATCAVTVSVDEDNDGGGGGSSSPRCELKISDKSINKGDRVTVEWETSNATFVELKDSTGKVLSTTDGKLSDDKKDYYDGEITLSPTKDTTYTLIAEKGSKDKECKVSVDVDEDDSVVVLENRDQQPLVTGISLTQVPYTGFEAGPFLTTLFYGLLLLWALYLAYVIVIRRNGHEVAFSHVAVEPTPMITSEKVSASMFAPATISTPRFVEPVAASSVATPIVGYAARDTVQDTIATEIENQAHVARVLFSSDALRTLIATTTDANRAETVKTVIAHAVSSYPSEDGWVVVNDERMKAATAASIVTAPTSAFTPSSVNAGNSSLAEAIVSGNIVAAYQMIGNRPMIALADAAADLDALYRIKQGGTATVSAYLASATVDTAKLQAAINALTGAIDGTYRDEAAAVKMAILKAVKAIS
jgi:hypothetical protein